MSTAETGPKQINGYYPLYDTISGANANGNGSHHTHVLEGVTYYMPNGVTNWHGNYPNPTFTIVEQPSNGTVSVNGEQVTYTPNTDFIGVDTFTYSVTINGLTSANVATSTVRVYPNEVTLTGEPKTGETLTANADLVLPEKFPTPAYVWKRDGVAIADQTAATYTLQPEDAGATITVTATFTHEGTVEKELSNSEGPIQVEDEAPVITFEGANPLHIAKDSTFNLSSLEKTVTDNVGVEEITETVSGPNGATTIDTSIPGTYTITATDAAGNSASANRAVTVDGRRLSQSN